jgi:hypothetical protein
MRPFRQIDLQWSWNGDLEIDEVGDLADTSSSSLKSFIQEAATRVRSDLYDWEMHPELGASLSDLVGEPNDEITAKEGRAKIISALTKGGLCNANLVKVRYMPVSRHQILYNVLFDFPLTEKEKEEGELRFALLFDTSQQGITLL